MVQHIRPALVLLVLLTLLTGLVYPLAMTGIAGVLFPYQAQGSLITQNGRVIGSALIGQNFTSARYFHGRPSATQALTAPYRKGAPWNETHWANDRYEKLLSDAQAETDEAKRKQYIWDMQAMLHDEGGCLIPVFSGTLDAYNQNVKGHSATGWLELNNCRISEKAWMDG